MGIEITATTGDLELLRSGYLAVNRAEGATIKLGNLTAVFTFSDEEKSVCSYTKLDNPKTLTATYNITGTIPFHPGNYSLVLPDYFGRSDNKKLHVWWRVARNFAEYKDVIDLHFSIFQEKPT